MEEDDEQFEVRDLRPKGWFWTDDEFLNGYARLLGTTFSMIYLDLCRHADKNQRAHPSQSTIAKELSLNISSVNEGIKVLEYFGLIRKIRIGKTCTNRYDLLGKKHWRRDFSELLSITERLEKLDKKNKNDVEQFKNTLSSDLAQFKITTLTVLNHYVNSSKSNSKETHSKVTHSKVTQKKGINSDLEIAPKVKRKDFRVKPEVYKEITDAYEKYKGIKLQGAEYGEVKRAIKTMLYSGRTKQNIIDFMKFCSEIDDDDKDLEWLKNWTLLTIKRKMPEFLAGKIKKKVDGEEEENYKVKFYGHTFEN